MGDDSRKHEQGRGKMNQESLGNSIEHISASVFLSRMEAESLSVDSHLSLVMISSLRGYFLGLLAAKAEGSHASAA